MKVLVWSVCATLALAWDCSYVKEPESMQAGAFCKRIAVWETMQASDRVRVNSGISVSDMKSDTMVNIVRDATDHYDQCYATCMQKISKKY